MLPSLPVYVDRWTRSSRRQFARNVGFNSGELRRVMKIAELGGEAPTPRLRGGAAPLRRPRGRPGHHVAAKRLINQCRLPSRLPNATACGGAGWALRQLFAFPALVERRPLNVSIGRSDHPVSAASGGGDRLFPSGRRRSRMPSPDQVRPAESWQVRYQVPRMSPEWPTGETHNDAERSHRTTKEGASMAVQCGDRDITE